MHLKTQNQNILIQEEYMNNSEYHIAKGVDVSMTWRQFQLWDIQIVSNWDASEVIIKIFDERGNLVNGWYLQGIR